MLNPLHKLGRCSCLLILAKQMSVQDLFEVRYLTVTIVFVSFNCGMCSAVRLALLEWCRWDERYSRIPSTMPLSFLITTFSASLTNLAVLLPLSHDCSCYVSRQYWHLHRSECRKQWPTRTRLRRQPRLPNVTCAWSWRLYGINRAICVRTFGEKNYLQETWMKEV
jgi:hypothetical protein